MNGPFSRIIEAVAEIATNLGGTISTNSGNRLADSLEVIADKAEDLSGGVLPAVTAADDGKILQVKQVNGEYKIVLVPVSEVINGGGSGGSGDPEA